MLITERPYALVDVETSGLYPWLHEIIEIAVIIFDQESLEITEVLDMKVWPAEPCEVDPRAAEVNGFNIEEWQFEPMIHEVMPLFVDITKDAIFCAHNVTFDWGFVETALRKLGMKDKMDYHRIDLFSLAYELLPKQKLEKASLDEIAVALGLKPEEKPHRAINGVMKEFEVYKKLRELIENSKISM